MMFLLYMTLILVALLMALFSIKIMNTKSVILSLIETLLYLIILFVVIPLSIVNIIKII